MPSVFNSHRPRIKVCCISSLEEAIIALEHGASALGLVGPMPSGPGILEDRQIKKIAQALPPGVSSFLLTSETKVTAIVKHQRFCGTNTIQLVSKLDGSYQELRDELPGVQIIQVIHVNGPESIREAQAVAPYVHAVLLDSGNPNAATPELGGTGRVHNWDVSREIVNSLDVPVFLAGGLNPNNIAEAWARVRPYGFDLCSGLRTNNQLDRVKVKQFFDQINRLS